MTNSEVHQRGRVPFPAFNGERVYMVPFTQAAGLPRAQRHWQPTVDAMLAGVDAGVVYLMVDQAPVRAGITHRRPGVHVDGYWHGPGHERHGMLCHGSAPSGHHPTPTHGPAPSTHGRTPAQHHQLPTKHSWETPSHCATGDREAVILATDVLGCAAYVGSFDLPSEWRGGDCSGVDVSRMDRVELAPGYAWAGHTLTMLHESIPHARDALRTVVRLNVPGWAPGLGSVGPG